MSKALDKYLDEMYSNSNVKNDNILQRLKKAGIINDYKIKEFTMYEGKTTSQLIKIYIKATSKSEFQLV